jgi:hypothetical protein
MGHLTLFMSGPNAAETQIKMISHLIMIGPALLGLSWRLASAAYALYQTSAPETSKALFELMDSRGSIPLKELLDCSAPINTVRILRELLLIEGVILVNAGKPTVTLTDTLRSDLIEACST